MSDGGEEKVGRVSARKGKINYKMSIFDEELAQRCGDDDNFKFDAQIVFDGVYKYRCSENFDPEARLASSNDGLDVGTAEDKEFEKCLGMIREIEALDEDWIARNAPKDKAGDDFILPAIPK